MKRLFAFLVSVHLSLVFSTVFVFAALAPDVNLTFQQPSYVTDKNPLLSEFTCDITKPECKVNFDLSSSFTGAFSSSDFLCSLDFGMGIPTGEEAKCNPNTVIFTGSYEYTVLFRIVSETDPAIFSERTIVVRSGYTPPEIPSGSGTLSESGSLADTGSIDGSGYLVSTGTISLITYETAVLSGVVFEPVTLTGTVYYGTGELLLSGEISSSFAFSGLLSDTDYSYRIGFVPSL